MKKVVTTAIQLSTLFLCAGSVAWLAGWFFVLGIALLHIAIYYTVDPTLVKRRLANPTSNAQTNKDKLLALLLVLAFLVWLPLAGLDNRFAWSSVPLWLTYLGALGFVVSLILLWITYRYNKYLSPAVEPQPGQEVVTRGPYAYIRHPMYAAYSLLMVSASLLLSSYFALLFALVTPTLYLLRIKQTEEPFLFNLAGYNEYAAHVPYRLIPGVW